MISFDVGSHRFQLRAAAVFVWNEQVLLHRLEQDEFWALPGGRVEPGEDAATTVVREMREELEEDVRCGSLAFAVENFFEFRGQPNHEIGLYFHASFSADSSLLDASRAHFGREGRHTLEFRWFPLSALASVDVRPSFLKEALARPAAAFEHVVQRG